MMCMFFFFFFFFFKQKTAYEMLLCDWSSDVCSSDLLKSSRALGSRPRTWSIPRASVSRDGPRGTKYRTMRRARYGPRLRLAVPCRMTSPFVMPARPVAWLTPAPSAIGRGLLPEGPRHGADGRCQDQE